MVEVQIPTMRYFLQKGAKKCLNEEFAIAPRVFLAVNLTQTEQISYGVRALQNFHQFSKSFIFTFTKGPQKTDELQSQLWFI